MIVKRPLIDPNVSYSDMTEDQLFSLWKAYYPVGSGPLSVMRTVCAAIENIAHLREMNVASWPERYRKETNS